MKRKAADTPTPTPILAELDEPVGVRGEAGGPDRAGDPDEAGFSVSLLEVVDTDEIVVRVLDGSFDVVDLVAEVVDLVVEVMNRTVYSSGQ